MAAETLTGDQLAACEKLVKHGGNNSDAVAAFVAVVPIESLFLALNAAATRRNELSRMLQSATAAVFSPPHGAGYAFEAEVVPFLVAGIGESRRIYDHRYRRRRRRRRRRCRCRRHRHHRCRHRDQAIPPRSSGSRRSRF